MLIDLSDVLSEYHSTIERDVPVEMGAVQTLSGRYPVLDRQDTHLVIEYAGQGKLRITGKAKLVLEIPCDRCLQPAAVPFDLSFSEDVDLKDLRDGQTEEPVEKNEMDGYVLDTERLLYDEILTGWPMKVLCREDCKGICSICGQNLNEGSCGCEKTDPDPRMSVIRDVFKNFKEV